MAGLRHFFPFIDFLCARKIWPSSLPVLIKTDWCSGSQPSDRIITALVRTYTAREAPFHLFYLFLLDNVFIMVRTVLYLICKHILLFPSSLPPQTRIMHAFHHPPQLHLVYEDHCPPRHGARPQHWNHTTALRRHRTADMQVHAALLSTTMAKSGSKLEVER